MQNPNKTHIATACGINRQTLKTATTVGKRINIATAQALCKCFNIPFSKYFSIERKEIKYSKNTNSGIKTILVVILGEAKRQQLIEHNYASKEYTSLKAGTAKEKEIYDEQEARAFVKAILNEPNPKKKLVFALPVFLGLRKAEICGLTWSNIDFECKTLSITQNTIYFQ